MFSMFLVLVKLRKSTVATHIATFTTEGCFCARLMNLLCLHFSRIYEVFMFITTNNALFIRSLKNIKRSLMRQNSSIPTGWWFTREGAELLQHLRNHGLRLMERCLQTNMTCREKIC